MNHAGKTPRERQLEHALRSCVEAMDETVRQRPGSGTMLVGAKAQAEDAVAYEHRDEREYVVTAVWGGLLDDARTEERKIEARSRKAAKEGVLARLKSEGRPDPSFANVAESAGERWARKGR